MFQEMFIPEVEHNGVINNEQREPHVVFLPLQRGSRAEKNGECKISVEGNEEKSFPRGE